MFGKLKQLFASRPNPVSSVRGTNKMAASANRDADIDTIHPTFMQTLLGGDPSVASDLSVPEKLVGQAVEQQLQSREQRATSVPRLPMVIPLLLKQLRDPNASTRDYVEIITQDPVVATAVLKVANSVYFNPYRKALDNFERAVAAIGVLKLRMVLSTAVLQPVILNRGDNVPEQVWEHSLACAMCCQHLAERENVDAFRAYLTGLIHDIGIVTLYNQTQLLSREYLDSRRPGNKLLEQLFVQWALPLSHWIAQDWQLSDDIVRALGEQHETTKSISALGTILRRSNRLCEAYHIYRAGKISREEVERLADSLRFTPKILDILDSGFGKLLDNNS